METLGPIGCDVNQKFEQFGKYLLLEKLATGGMAEVFLARAQAAGGITKFVAIKRILPQYAESPEFIDMFKDEAKIAVNLNHSNIVSIHDFGVQSNQFYLVMDYVEGRNLRQILNKLKKSNLRLTIDQVIYIIKETSSGLDHAHRCLDGSTGRPLNITHRDMSPQNVMISFEGEVRIVDFGIAKAESQIETTRAGTLKGKFGYMSPEQAEGHPVDLRTDIFSLGIVLWELLANDRLFIASSELNTLRKIRDCQVPSLRKINPNIPSELERITMKALARDRNLRYQTAAAMHRDLNRFLNRQYPEFSAQDFASYIKNQFAEEIFSTRQRLVDYAKIPFTDLNEGVTRASISPLSPPRLIKSENSSTALTDSFISGEPSGSNVSIPTGQTSSMTSGAHPRPDTFSDISENKNFSFGGDGSKASEMATQLSSLPNLPQPPTSSKLDEKALRRELHRARTDSPPGVETADELSHSSITRNRSLSQTGFSYTGRRRRQISTQTILGCAAALFVLSAYAYMAKYHRKQAGPMINALDPYLRPFHSLIGVEGERSASSEVPQPPTEPPPPTPEVPPPPTPSVVGPPPKVAVVPSSPTPQIIMDPAPLSPNEPRDSVLVTSTPSGAEVLVNGAPTGSLTPSRVEVPKKRPFTLTLRKTGFIDYRRDSLRKESVGSRFSATLQPAVIGFLDIDVTPPQNVRLYINGRWLKGEHLPISGYAVPAETPVTVRAEDQTTGQTVQQIVKVPKDRRISVRLDLRRSGSKNDRQPSRNR